MSNNYSKWAPPGTKRRRKGWRKRRRERRARLAQEAAERLAASAPTAAPDKRSAPTPRGRTLDTRTWSRSGRGSHGLVDAPRSREAVEESASRHRDADGPCHRRHHGPVGIRLRASRCAVPGLHGDGIQHGRALRSLGVGRRHGVGDTQRETQGREGSQAEPARSGHDPVRRFRRGEERQSDARRLRHRVLVAAPTVGVRRDGRAHDARILPC